MLEFFRAYRRAFQYFALGLVLRDLWRSLLNIVVEIASIVFKLGWIVASPFLTLLEVNRPGLIDRWLFRLSRQ